MMTNNNCNLKCKPGKFKRLRPFHGMLLTDEDFLQEQTYLREKLRSHNRLYGWGVVWGLRLRQKSDSVVIVEPGMAFDCLGNEIVVCGEGYDIDFSQLSLTMQLRRAECQSLRYSRQESPTKWYVGIKYCECDSDPVPLYSSDCVSEKKLCDFSRVKEGCVIKLFTEDTLPTVPPHFFPDERDQTASSNPVPMPDVCSNDSEHYVILGSVEISVNSGSTIIENIDNWDQREYMLSFPFLYYWFSPYYEAIRRSVVQKLCKDAEWKNISVVVGMTEDMATEKLTKMGMTVKRAVLSIIDMKSKFEMAMRAIPFSAPGSEIELVFDKDPDTNPDARVLFPLDLTYLGAAEIEALISEIQTLRKELDNLKTKPKPKTSGKKR